MLPPGQVEPNPLALQSSPSLGGYRLLLAVFGSLWCAGLVAILVLGRRKHALAEADSARPVTLADRLGPLVDAAVAGTLSKGQHAELERLLIGYWRKRLGLEQASPAAAITAMRDHPEAGPLLRKLEEWLHKPGARTEPVDVAGLLRPYQNLPADEPEGETRREAVAGSGSSTIGAPAVSFAYPFVLVLLAVPLLLLGWVWKRREDASLCRLTMEARARAGSGPESSSSPSRCRLFFWHS